MNVSELKAVRSGIPIKKSFHLLKFNNSELYSPKEKAALAFVEEVTKKVQVDDAVLLELKSHWSDREIIEITYAASVENFLNRMVKPLGIGSDNL